MKLKANSQASEINRRIYQSKEADKFDIYAPCWVLSYGRLQGLRIPDFREWPTKQKEALLRTLAERATKNQHSSIQSDISAIKSFTQFFSDSDDFFESGIDVENLLLWFASSRNEESKLQIRRLILNSIEFGYEYAFESGVMSLAQQYIGKRIRLHPERYEASRSFTESERKQLYYQLARESYLGKIPSNVRVPSTLILVTGKRPIQISHSKFIDFSLEEVNLSPTDKRQIIIYNVPVAKQRGLKFRSQFNKMPLVSSFQIWEDLEKLRAEHIDRIYKLLGIRLSEEQSFLLPIFMTNDNSTLIKTFNKAMVNGLDLDQILRSDRLHQYKDNLAGLVRKLGDYISILSEFTGLPISINAKRFRHTRATNLALNGASIEEIADALDHSDTRSAIEYVDNLPVRAIKIGNHVEDTLGELAKKFSGLKIENSDQVINLYTKNGVHNVGVCGIETFCTENYPIACYECELFNPNPFGNHAAVQEYVENELHIAKSIGDNRLIENWNTILLAVLERRYIADQYRLKALKENPENIKNDIKRNDH